MCASTACESCQLTQPPYNANSHSAHGTTIQCQLTQYIHYHHTMSTHTVHTLPPHNANSHSTCGTTIQCQLTQYIHYHHTMSTHTTTIQCQLTQCIQHEEYCHTVARYQEILDCRVVSEDVLPNVERVVPVVSQQIGVFVPGQCKPCGSNIPRSSHPQCMGIN